MQKKCFLVKYKNAEMEKLRIDSYTKMIIWRTPQLKKKLLALFMRLYVARKPVRKIKLYPAQKSKEKQRNLLNIDVERTQIDNG